MSPKCEQCTKHSSFGFPGEKARWCKSHRPNDAVDLNSKRCEKCDRHASYAAPGSKKRRWCKDHCPDGARTTDRRRCEFHGCMTRPLFGINKGQPKWCKKHKQHGDIDVVHPTCEHPECGSLNPVFGVLGRDRRGRWCAKHRPSGAEDLHTKRCEHPGCPRIKPVFGVPGRDKSGRWCAQHRPPNAENLRDARCEFKGCKHQPTFGVPGVDQRARWCAAHKPEGAEDVKNKHCKVEGCPNISTKHQFCAQHDTDRKRRTRVRENQVANHLREVGLHWTSWNKQLTETACGRYRPDFAFEQDTHVVVLEVDEHQHARPGYSCDAARMLDIFGAYGGLPVVFLRFNPDAFLLNGETKRVQFPTRLRVLETQLRACLEKPPPHQLTIVRLFYDDPEDVVATTWVAADDPAFQELPLGSTSMGPFGAPRSNV